MADCVYCGRGTGFFGGEAHSTCSLRVQEGLRQLQAVVVNSVAQGKGYDDLKQAIERTGSDLRLPKSRIVSTVKQGWSEGAILLARKEPVCASQLDTTWSVFEGVGLTREEVSKTPGFIQMTLSVILWFVLSDQIDAYQGPIQFNLQQGEVPVFGIANVLVSEPRTVTSYEGAYGGATIRVATGLYYHLGSTRGHKVNSTEIQEVDYGDLLVTTLGVYFGGREKGQNSRMPYQRILRFNAYSDAVGICKDGGREQIFSPQQLMDSGWFLFNLLQALSARSQRAISTSS